MTYTPKGKPIRMTVMKAFLCTAYAGVDESGLQTVAFYRMAESESSFDLLTLSPNADENLRFLFRFRLFYTLSGKTW